MGTLISSYHFTSHCKNYFCFAFLFFYFFPGVIWYSLKSG